MPNQQVYYNAESHQPFAYALALVFVHADAEEISQQGGEDEQQYHQPRSLVVEEKAGEEQESVAQQTFAVQERKHGHYQCQKYPEIELGEQQRVLVVEREQVRNESCQIVHRRGMRFR